VLAELLFVPALVGYGEAALAYVREAQRPGLAGRVAIWGVRLGWLAHTALLVAEAERERAFPWATWSGALNLFVWLVVAAYLIWGCKPRFRLLGVAVMPLAALLLLLAVIGGPSGAGDASTVFLVAHVGLILAGFAAFTLAAGLSGFYLWEGRRLKRRSATLLRLRVPPLETLDRLARRALAVGVVAAGLGIAVGLVSLDGRVDAAMTLALAGWSANAVALVHRRRPYLVLAALVPVAGALSLGHFA
jgi:ABC-type uncharacterized transport system permease subunit